MYSSILVVGGGLMFHGAQEFLLHRIINKMPPSFRRLVDNIEIITRPKVTHCVPSIPWWSTQISYTHVQAANALCVILCLSHVTNLGHGPSAHILERRSRAGLSGHHSGNVDPPAGVAALWRPDATWESCFCLVKLCCIQPQCQMSSRLDAPVCNINRRLVALWCYLINK